MKRVWILVAISVVGFSCGQFNATMLQGKWQGDAIEEQGSILPISGEEIELVFLNNTTYTYKSTLNYKEAGTYSLKGDLLYRRDTLNAASHQMRVKIIRLDADSLFFKMMENGRERTLKLFRVD